MLLRMNFEELQALHHGMDLIIDPYRVQDEGAVMTAPSPLVVQLDALRDRLTGDLSVYTLADQARLRENVGIVCDRLKERLDELVIEYHPAHEDAVAAYFAYGYGRAVLRRLDRMGEEMHALAEVMTGRETDERTEQSLHFPD